MSSDVVALGAVVVSAMGAVFGLYQARKADRSANTTKTIEIGVTQLVDQYQETNRELRVEIHEANEKCKSLQKEVFELQRKVENLETTIDNQHAEIIRLRRELGEPIT